jgi:hypothetical protein
VHVGRRKLHTAVERVGMSSGRVCMVVRGYTRGWKGCARLQGVTHGHGEGMHDCREGAPEVGKAHMARRGCARVPRRLTKADGSHMCKDHSFHLPQI